MEGKVIRSLPVVGGAVLHSLRSDVTSLCLLVLPNERRTLQIQHGVFFHPVAVVDGRPGTNPRPPVHLSAHLSVYPPVHQMV